MLFSLLSVAALVLSVAAWVTSARRGARHVSTIARVSIFGFAVAGVAAAVTGTWAALAVSVVALVVFALLGVVSRQLSVDRYPSTVARDALRELGGEVAAGGEGTPLVGEMWDMGDTLYLVATVRDNDSELDLWVRAAQVAMRGGPEGVCLLMVAEGSETRNVTVAGSEATIVAPENLAGVVRPARGSRANRAQRRRKR